MISYDPLMATLKKKGLGFPDLLKRMNTDSGKLKISLNEGRYLSLSTIDKICTALDCQVEDVVKWRKGDQVLKEVRLHCVLDWEKVDEAILSRNMDGAEVGIAMGKSRSWYNSARRSDVMLKSNARLMFKVLDVRYEDYVKEEVR